MNLVKRFLCDSRDQWWRLVVLTAALMLAACFEIIAPRLLGNIVDAIVHGLEQQREITAILDGTTDTVLLLVAFYTCHAVFTYVSEFIIAGASQHMVLALRPRKPPAPPPAHGLFQPAQPRRYAESSDQRLGLRR